MQSFYCPKEKRRSEKYYENHRTVKWARIFASLPRPLSSTAPPTFFDEFRYRYHATPQWNMSRAGRVYERGQFLNECGSKKVLDFQGKASFPTVQWKVVPLQVPVLLLSPRLSAMTVEEENLYLEMGVTESLKSYSLTPKNTEQSEMTRSDRQPDVDEPDYGLWFLFTAAKIVSDWTAVSLFSVSRFTNYRNVISWCIVTSPNIFKYSQC